MLTIVCVAGVTGICTGTFAAAFSDVLPAYRKQLNNWGSSVLVASVLMLGLTLPLI